MALDAGTVNIKINAQTGDTKQRIDEVKNSLESMGDASKLVTAAMSLAVAGVASKALDLGGNLYSSLVVPMQRASRDINSTGKAAQDELAALGNAAAGVVENIPIVGDAIAGVITGHANLAVEEMNILNAYKDDLMSYIDDVAAYADDVLTNSALVGFSAETVQVYQKLQGITDVDFATITTGMRGFNEAIKEAKTGSGDAKDAFDKLGVSLTDVNGEAKDADTLWREVIDAFQKTGDSLSDNEKWAIAVELFGSRAAQALMPIITNSDMSYESLLALVDEVGILNDTELNMAGSVQDLKDLSDAAKQTTQDLMGLSIAEQTNATSQAELDFEKAKRGLIRGDINPDTGEIYTWEDVVQKKVTVEWENNQLDILNTNLAKVEKNIEEASIEAVKTSATLDEATEKALEGITVSGPLTLNINQTDLREEEGLLNYYDSNPDLFDAELTQAVSQHMLSIIESERFDELWKGTPAELNNFSNLFWDAIEGEVILNPEFVKGLSEEFGNRAMPESGVAQGRFAKDVYKYLTSGITPIFYGGSYEDLLAAAWTQPSVEQKIAGEEPSVNNGTINNYGDNSGNTNSNNTTYNTYNYSADLSTGDMN